MDKKEYIERINVKAMIRLYEEWKCPPTAEALKAVNDIFVGVCEIPTANVAPVMHGEWVDRDGKTWCNVCGASNKQYKPPYCPHCGAKMDGGKA